MYLISISHSNQDFYTFANSIYANAYKKSQKLKSSLRQWKMT
nr:MAG TPA: hypothetical protein [Caudoviricetes sp.]